MTAIDLDEIVFFKYSIGYHGYMAQQYSHYCRGVGRVKTIDPTNGNINVSPFEIIDVDPPNHPFTDMYNPVSSSSSSELIIWSSDYQPVAHIPVNIDCFPGMTTDERKKRDKFFDLVVGSEMFFRSKKMYPIKIADGAMKVAEATTDASRDLKLCAGYNWAVSTLHPHPPPPPLNPPPTLPLPPPPTLKLIAGKTYSVEKKVLGKLISQKIVGSKCIYTFERFNETSTSFDLIVETLEESLGMNVVTLDCSGTTVVLDGTR